MAKALSVDLRRRVVDAIEHGLSCRQVGGTVWGERIKHEPLA